MLEILNFSEYSKCSTTKEPRLSIGIKTGYFFFNEPATQIMSLSLSDKINFGFDKGKNAWYIIKQDRKNHNAFELRSYGKRKNGKSTKCLMVTCAKIAWRIASNLAIKKREGSIHFSIDPEPVAQDGFVTYKINLLK